MFYSKQTGGFYSPEIHGKNMPPDSVEISAAKHALMLSGQAVGKRIAADDAGHPALIERPGPTMAQLAHAAREKRNTLIAATDYMFMADYPTDAAGLAPTTLYRQALRDITVQPGFPGVIDWPVLPAA